jgi:hypothetical protein
MEVPVTVTTLHTKVNTTAMSTTARTISSVHSKMVRTAFPPLGGVAVFCSIGFLLPGGSLLAG